MFLSYSDKLKDEGDYVVLVDYGSEGIVVLSQHDELEGAIVAMHKCTYGSPISIAVYQSLPEDIS